MAEQAPTQKIGDEILTRHPAAAKKAVVWQAARDFAEGADAVRAAGPRYVPRLRGQTEEEYRAYLQRGEFFNGFRRTVNALAGIAFARSPQVDVPDSRTMAHLADITLTDEPFHSFAARVVREVLTVGRGGCLIDFAEGEQRPYWVYYRAEDILNWDTVVAQGDTILTFLVLLEHDWVRKGFEIVCEQKVRVLEIVDTPTGRRYQVTVYRRQKVEGVKEEWVIESQATPVRRGAPLDFIPFVFFGPFDQRPEVHDPPLKDLLELNVSHWRTSVDLKHAEHFTALPTPVITGDDRNELHIGSAKAIVLPDPNAKAFYLEYSGQGLDALRKSLLDTERRMAILGSRMLEAQKTQAEAAATVRMRHAGDDATLASIVGSISSAFTTALQITAWWDGVTNTRPDAAYRVALNQEFGVVDLPLDTLSLLAQADKISYATLYYNLERAGLTRPNITALQEREQIRLEGGLDPMSRPPDAGRDDDDPGEGADGEPQDRPLT